MADLKPFKAIRPTRDKVHLVASRPVYTYKPSILAAKLEENPYTFIQIIHPEYFENEENKTAPNSDERFERVKEKYNEFINDGVLVKEKEEAVYIYRQRTDVHVFVGIIAGASIEEYDNNLIKKHEATLSAREEMFTRYLDIVGMNAEPVLLCHPHNPSVTDLLTELTTLERPEYEFTTTDRITHELWVITGENKDLLLNAYKTIPSTYIADGHHRSASSARLLNKLSTTNSSKIKENTHYFLSFIMDEALLDVQPYNRICKTTNNLTKTEFLEQLSTKFDITPLNTPSAPTRSHEIHMTIENEWYCLKIKSEYLTSDKTVEKIDAALLSTHVLSPILGIKDLKTDPNIGFISGEEGVEGMVGAMKKEKNKIGFMLFPVSGEQLMRVADDNDIMPPKSTWINPKLRSGLTIYNLFE